MKKIFYILYIFISVNILFVNAYAQRTDNTPQHSVVPIFINIGGVGGAYGAGYLNRNFFANDSIFALGGSLGDIVSGGIFYEQALSQRLRFNISGAYINSKTALTSYQRGSNQDFDKNNYYRLDTSTIFANSSFRYSLVESFLYTNAGLTLSDTSFNEFKNENDEVINLPDLHITNLTILSLNLSMGLEYIRGASEAPLGVDWNLGVDINSESSGYSGTNVLSSTLNYYVPIYDKLNATGQLFYSQAFVRERIFDSKEEVSEELNIDCSQVSNAGERIECEELSDELAYFISEHNKYGTAEALGGPIKLRGFFYNQIRGAITAYTALETRYTINSIFNSVDMEIAVFGELGQSADKRKNLDDKTLHSYGGGLRVLYNDFVYRIDYAVGNENSYVTAVVGRSW